MTIALVAAIYFKGNHATATRLLKDKRYLPRVLSKSQFSYRLHQVRWRSLQFFNIRGEYRKGLNLDTIYAIESFPILVCDTYRIQRCKIYNDKKYRGYIAGKERFFFGLKIHLMVTKDGHPVEFFLTEESVNDVGVMDVFDFDVQPDSEIYANRLYNYWIEDVIHESGLGFEPHRRSNSKRDQPQWRKYWIEIHRKRVEMTGSLFERLLPKHIYATNATGLELKVVLFVLPTSLKFAL